MPQSRDARRELTTLARMPLGRVDAARVDVPVAAPACVMTLRRPRVPRGRAGRGRVYNEVRGAHEVDTCGPQKSNRQPDRLAAGMLHGNRRPNVPPAYSSGALHPAYGASAHRSEHVSADSCPYPPRGTRFCGEASAVSDLPVAQRSSVGVASAFS